MTDTTPAPALDFASRHIGPRPHDIDTMLAAIGYGSLAELIEAERPRPGSP